MNIKSLLLGSAAALIAVSGARAADAVVMVEPEPVEYVRVCDVYGTGFFYIPGTETCLKLGGYVRMRVVAADNAFNNDVDYGNLNTPVLAPGEVRGFGNDDYAVTTRVRARLDFDAREETELGMLRSFIRVEATNTGSSNEAYTMENAYLQLGGLTAGYKDSVWAERDGLFVDNDFSVGDITQNVLSYTFAVAGFTAAVSLEDDNSGDFVPDVVGQLAYEGGWGEAYLSGVYDEQRQNTPNVVTVNGVNYGISLYNYTANFDDPRTAAVLFASTPFYNGDLNDDDGAFALKAGVTLKDLIATGSQFKIEGSYAFDPTRYTSIGNMTGTFGAAGNGFQSQAIFVTPAGTQFLADTRGVNPFALSSEYQIGAGYQQSFNKLTARVAGYYGETFDLKFIEPVPGSATLAREINLGSAEYYGGGVNLEYALTSNFSIMGEVNYFDIDLPSTLSDADRTSGFIEIKRTF